MGGKPIVAFVTGGYSSEAVVSYQSAINIEKNLDTEKYEVYKIDIRPDGWMYEYENGKVIVDRDDFSTPRWRKKDLVRRCVHWYSWNPRRRRQTAGIFRSANIPYTSCDAAASAITFNKRYTVAVAAFAGIDTAKSLHLFSDLPYSDESIAAELSFPLFVKPNNGGSSIGMSKVD